MHSANFFEKSISELKGVGEILIKKLSKLGILTFQDLLLHLPFRYQNKTQLTPIASLKVGEISLVEGVVFYKEIQSRRRSILIVTLKEHNAYLKLRFFHLNKIQVNKFLVGSRIRCYGEVRYGPHGLEMIHPEVDFCAQEKNSLSESLTPVYPSMQGLSQKLLRKLVLQVLALLKLDKQLRELINKEIIERYQWGNLLESLNYIHNPPPDAATEAILQGKHPSVERLIFEELLAHQLGLRKLRFETQKNKAPQFELIDISINDFEKALPFQLTVSQKRVIKEIIEDTHSNVPMMRLVQGDVGSGKTVIAAYSALLAIKNGFQVAIMAPTEMLSEQHFNTLSQWLKNFDINISLLQGRSSKNLKEVTLEQIGSGYSSLVIGTHALFQEQVAFKNLGLVVIDEQHRFGVQQRLKLQNKGNIFPHQLVMSATPIPRTIAMAAYADLDISVIDELPPGRIPVETVVMPNSRREEIIRRIIGLCQNSKQVYWVCPLIEASEKLQCQAAEKTAILLAEKLKPYLVGLLHGKMKTENKEEVIKLFRQGDIKVLVATTVIEVGIDIPNAVLMVIENAERLGLSQLHQLRGRVGRGSEQSFCILLYQMPLSAIAKERLKIIRETTDGFKIAQQDLNLRGAGDLFGIRQTGLSRMKIAEIGRDQKWIEAVQKESGRLLDNDPEVANELIARWLAEREKFIRV